MYKRVVVTGSLAYDHIMSMPGRFKDHIMPDKIHILNVSFIMHTFRQEFGGTGGNISYSLDLLKTPTLLAGAAGSDFASYLSHLKRLGNVDISGIKIFLKTTTARGFVITDKDDNQIWVFYEGSMKQAKKITLKNFLRKGDLLVAAPNDPLAVMKFVKEAISKDIPYVFDPAFNIPHFKVEDLRLAVKKSHILIGNDYENELIARLLKINRSKLSQHTNILITTLGPKGSYIQQGGKNWKIPPAKPKNESDPTGAGDAYRAGFLAGYSKGLPLDTCGRLGSLTAAYSVETYGTQTHKFNIKGFVQRYRKNFRHEDISTQLFA